MYKVLMYFTPTSDPHAPYYFQFKENIESYISNIFIGYSEANYTIEEVDVNENSSEYLSRRD